MDIPDNPFAMLTAVAAPAILTNACSILSLGTANRIARVVDRSRVVMDLHGVEDGGSLHHKAYVRQLDSLRRRSRTLLKALRLFYTALAMFAATAFAAIVGSIAVAFQAQLVFHGMAALGFIVGSLGVAGLVTGCVMMVRETRMAIDTLADEHATYQSYSKQKRK